jgi:hypothetical protein
MDCENLKRDVYSLVQQKCLHYLYNRGLQPLSNQLIVFASFLQCRRKQMTSVHLFQNAIVLN